MASESNLSLVVVKVFMLIQQSRLEFESELILRSNFEVNVESELSFQQKLKVKVKYRFVTKWLQMTPTPILKSKFKIFKLTPKLTSQS